MSEAYILEKPRKSGAGWGNKNGVRVKREPPQVLRGATPREQRTAHGLLLGKSRRQAMLDAGYKEAYANSKAGEVCNRPAVKMAMLEIYKNIKPGELGAMAKVLLHEDLQNPPETWRERLALTRLGLEADGMIGGPSELHLHQHTTLPPAVQAMLEDKMKEIMQLRAEPARDNNASQSSENS